MSTPEHLLNSKQMAEFASQGFIRFDEVVPLALCEAAKAEFDKGKMRHSWRRQASILEAWPEDDVIGKIIRLPKVAGALHSLVGPNPTYDHHAVHTNRANLKAFANLHQDAEIDTRFDHFDIQFSLFVHDVPPEMGGTLFVPGSHFRRVHESQINRYQNIVGQVQTVCKAGTIVFWHHNVWHSSRSNRTDQTRYMFKMRLNPTVRQVRLWDTSDLDDPEVMGILSKTQIWHAQEHRIEQFHRARFWRSLTGNSDFDIAMWWTRVENEPETIAS